MVCLNIRQRHIPPRLVGGRRMSKVHKWLFDDDLGGQFLMLPPELLEMDAFQDLTHAARMFYIVLNVHKETSQQRDALLQTMKEYNDLLGWGKTKDDLEKEAAPNKKTKDTQTHGFFVCPEKHLKAYGYSSQYANKLKRELIEHGFIRIVAGGKGKSKGWDKNVTLYQFSSMWKRWRKGMKCIPTSGWQDGGKWVTDEQFKEIEQEKKGERDKAS